MTQVEQTRSAGRRPGPHGRAQPVAGPGALRRLVLAGAAGRVVPQSRARAGGRDRACALPLGQAAPRQDPRSAPRGQPVDDRAHPLPRRPHLARDTNVRSWRLTRRERTPRQRPVWSATETRARERGARDVWRRSRARTDGDERPDELGLRPRAPARAPFPGGGTRGRAPQARPAAYWIIACFGLSRGKGASPIRNTDVEPAVVTRQRVKGLG
jgi:hypothetical protein